MNTRPFSPVPPSSGNRAPTQPLPVRGEQLPIESTEWYKRMENIAGMDMPEDVRQALYGLHELCAGAYERLQSSGVLGEATFTFVKEFKENPESEDGKKLLAIKEHQDRAKKGEADNLLTVDHSLFELFSGPERDEAAISDSDARIAKSLLQQRQVFPSPPRPGGGREQQTEQTPYDIALLAAKDATRRVRTAEENDRVIKTAESYMKARRGSLGDLHDINDQELAKQARTIGQQCADELLLREVKAIHGQLIEADKARLAEARTQPAPRGLGRLALGKKRTMPTDDAHYRGVKKGIADATSFLEVLGKDDPDSSQPDNNKIAGVDSKRVHGVINDVIKKKYNVDIIAMKQSNVITATDSLDAIKRYLNMPNSIFNQTHLPVAVLRSGEIDRIVEQYIEDLSPKRRPKPEHDNEPHSSSADRKAIEDAAAAGQNAQAGKRPQHADTHREVVATPSEERTLGTKEAWQQQVDDAIEGLLAQSQVSEQAASAALQDVYRRFVLDETAPVSDDPNGMPPELRKKQSDYTKAQVLKVADRIRQNLSNL